MIPWGFRIEGSFGGVDPILVIVASAVTVAVIVATAVVARQLARLQPKAPPPSQVQKASAELDAWTERPKAQSEKDQEYYSLYGSQPGRPASASGPRAPPVPASPLGAVMVDLSGGAPARQDAWVSAAEPSSPYVPASAPPRMHPPPRPTGPSDEVVAASHSRRVRDTATGEVPPRESARPPFERNSVEPGAVTPALPPGDPFSPRAAPPPAPPAPTPPPRISTPSVSQSLPESLPSTSAKAAFRGPSRGQTVVGAGTTGVQEGTVISPEKKAIRCPKCQTVFAGPAARPATVKCPACGTTGNLK
jgi:hypothetical protein